MKNRPLVLIVSRRLERKNKLVNWVSESHLSMLMQQGVMPLIVPIVEETLIQLDDYLQNMSGLLMVEGGDIIPENYGMHNEEGPLDEPDDLKDKIEIKIFNTASDRGVPVLGICRGNQLINVLQGGTLRNWDKSSVAHINYEQYDAHRHALRIVKGTPLYEWYQKENLEVNSYHHQGIDKLAPDFKAMAYTHDGLIEGIYNPKAPFMVGLQFHPERMLNEYTGNLKVFEAFGNAVKEYSEKQ